MRTRAYRSSGSIPAFPAQWLYGLLRALPGERAFLPPSSLRSLLLRNLTPASRCQDHTSSPSASAPFVKGTSAATASHPALLTIAKRPSYRDGTKSIYHRFGPEVKLNSEKQKCIGGQVRSDEAARGAQVRRNALQSRRASTGNPDSKKPRPEQIQTGPLRWLGANSWQGMRPGGAFITVPSPEPCVDLAHPIPPKQKAKPRPWRSNLGRGRWQGSSFKSKDSALRERQPQL
jgi:hypothetical protein